MKAVVCREFGPAENLEVAEVPDPVAGPGQVLVGVEAAGVNYPDALMVAGTYQLKPERPFIPGSEVCGRVLALGEGVTGLEVGQRVAAFCGTGGYAEQVVVPAAMATPLAEEVPVEHGAVLPVVYGTAQHGLVNRADLQPGETVLVLGAAGGVGMASIQLAVAAGADVVAVVSTPQKAELAERAGAGRVVIDDGSGQAPGLADLEPEFRADVVVDTVGGELAVQAMRRLAWYGRYLVVGFAAGEIPQVRLNRVLLSSSSVIGVLWGAWAKRQPEANDAMMRSLATLLAEGRIAPHVHRTFDLDQAPQALAEVSGRHVRGKVVLRVGATA